MINVCELFAGVGGFRVGLEKSSPEYNFVWANQWEPSRKLQHAYNCYVNHFGTENHVNIDIAEINKNEIRIASDTILFFDAEGFSVTVLFSALT